MATEAAIANPASSDAGSALANPSDALDNPDDFSDFREPDEANPDEADAGTDPNGETAETDEETGQEAEKPDPEGEEADEAEADEKAAEVADDVLVRVGDEQLPLKELKAGYMKDRDYRLKTAELGNKRQHVEQMTASVTKSVGALVEFLEQQIPPAPTPSLAMTDPARFVQEQAMHEAAKAQMMTVLKAAQDVKDVENKLTAEQRAEQLAQENAKLAEAFPSTATPEGRKKFFDTAAAAARELGYTEDDIKAVSVHRTFALAHYAAIGLRTEKAKKEAAKKVENVPPVPVARRQQGPNAAAARANQDAMKRLRQTGSINDALAIDFE